MKIKIKLKTCLQKELYLKIGKCEGKKRERKSRKKEKMKENKK